jgi:hypothetical protein
VSRPADGPAASSSEADRVDTTCCTAFSCDTSTLGGRSSEVDPGRGSSDVHGAGPTSIGPPAAGTERSGGEGRTVRRPHPLRTEPDNAQPSGRGRREDPAESAYWAAVRVAVAGCPPLDARQKVTLRAIFNFAPAQPEPPGAARSTTSARRPAPDPTGADRPADGGRSAA